MAQPELSNQSPIPCANYSTNTASQLRILEAHDQGQYFSLICREALLHHLHIRRDLKDKPILPWRYSEMGLCPPADFTKVSMKEAFIPPKQWQELLRIFLALMDSNL